MAAPGLLDVDWDALLPSDPVGRAVGPELPDLAALHAALRADERPPLTGLPDWLYEAITARIVVDWRPLRIILFGSRAWSGHGAE